MPSSKNGKGRQGKRGASARDGRSAGVSTDSASPCGNQNTPRCVSTRPIVITIGDISVDWHWFNLSESGSESHPSEGFGAGLPDTSSNHQRCWHSKPSIEPVALHGGAWYIDNFLRIYIGPDRTEQLFSYKRLPSSDLRMNDPRMVLHSFTDYCRKPLDASSRDDDSPRVAAASGVFRVQDYPRYFGPPATEQIHPRLVESGKSNGYKEVQMQGIANNAGSDKNELGVSLEALVRQKIEGPSIIPGDAISQIVVIHDSGNGFSLDRKNWETVLRPLGEHGNPHVKAVILNLEHVGILTEGRKVRGHLWNYLALNNYLPRTVVVVGADDLRRAGVKLSRSLSWERTAYDFNYRLRLDPLLEELSKAGHIVVRFGISGAIHYISDEQSCFLYYDPEHVEAEYRRPDGEGRMFGYSGIISATIAKNYFEKLWSLPTGGGKLPQEAPVGSATVSADVTSEIYLRSGDADREVYTKTLLHAVEESVQEGLGNCRAYFRQGFGSDESCIRQRMETWDHLDVHKRIVMGCGKDDDDDSEEARLIEVPIWDQNARITSMNWKTLSESDGDLPLKQGWIGIDKQEMRLREEDQVQVCTFTYQLDIAEKPYGEHLLFPGKVIDQYATQIRRALENEWKQVLEQSNPESGLLAVLVKHQSLPQRFGKAFIFVHYALRFSDPPHDAWKSGMREFLLRHPDSLSVADDNANEVLRQEVSLGEMIDSFTVPVPGKGEPSHPQSTWRLPQNRGAKQALIDILEEMGDRLLLSVHEITAKSIYWKYSWPIALCAFEEGFDDFAKVRVESDPEWSILNSKSTSVVLR